MRCGCDECKCVYIVAVCRVCLCVRTLKFVQVQNGFECIDKWYMNGMYVLIICFVPVYCY